MQEDGTLVRLSKITREYFTTEIPTVTENSITLEVESTGTTLSAVATPYTNDKYYNLNWNNESTLVNAGYTDGTVAERCFQFEYDYMTMYMGFYPVTAWANVKQGPATTSTVMTKPGTYYLFAYFINDDATADGEIILKTYPLINDDKNLSGFFIKKLRVTQKSMTFKGHPFFSEVNSELFPN